MLTRGVLTILVYNYSNVDIMYRRQLMSLFNQGLFPSPQLFALVFEGPALHEWVRRG